MSFVNIYGVIYGRTICTDAKMNTTHLSIRASLVLWPAIQFEEYETMGELFSMLSSIEGIGDIVHAECGNMYREKDNKTGERILLLGRDQYQKQ
jgi:hypothetical protein